MQIFDNKKIASFKQIMNRHFVNIEDTKIGVKIKPFMIELESSGFDKSDIMKYTVNFLTEILLFGEEKLLESSHHVSRDFAMALFANVSSDKVAGVEYPYAKKVDFMMFLAGILDSPDQSNTLSNYIGKFAQRNEDILITGESGTDKELHASVMHYLSSRLNKMFIRFNCASIPKELMESELFGTVKGIATDMTLRDGILHAVGDGTLFIDEIGDMPLNLQAKFLRVLQSRKFNKVGDYKTEYTFKARVIAATNRDLKADIKASPTRFRPDLFYRLNVLPIELPSLRNIKNNSERDMRIMILNKLRYIAYMLSVEPSNSLRTDFLTRSRGVNLSFNKQSQPLHIKDERFISDEALQLLVDYDFPGNYRELDNILRQAYILSDYGRIEVTALPSEVIEHKETESPEYKQKEIDIDTTFLKDITYYANQIKKDIVRKKIESIYQSGKTITSTLKSEGVTDKKDYQRIRKNIVSIIGQAEMSRITKGA